MIVHFNVVFSIFLLKYSGTNKGFLFETAIAAEIVSSFPEITITKFPTFGSEDGQILEFSICIFPDFKVGFVDYSSYRLREANMPLFSIFKK